MYNIIICEDNQNESELLHNNICRYFAERERDYCVTEFCTGEGFLSVIETLSADIVFFDVELGRVSGIDIAKQLRAVNKRVIIIFITHYPYYVFSSFSAEPLNYLIKPLQYGAFEEVMQQALIRIDQYRKDSYVIMFNNIVYFIPLPDIIYFESNLRVVNIVTSKEIYNYYSTLNEIERNLKKEEFIRCHQSYIINIKHVIKFENSKLLMSNGSTIFISRSKLKRVRTLLFDYVGKQWP